MFTKDSQQNYIFIINNKLISNKLFKLFNTYPYYESPHEMGRHNYCLAPLYVCPSVCLYVRHAFVSALYLLNPWWDFQITLHTYQVWWDDVQCLCLTKVGSRSRSQSKIKHCMTVTRVRFISFIPLVGLTNTFAQMSAMLRRCAVPMFDQGWFKVKVRIEDKTLYDLHCSVSLITIKN